MAGKDCSFQFEFRVVPRPDPAADADSVRRTLANLIAREIAAELQALDKSPAAQPQVGTEGAEAGEDRKAAGPAAAARTPAPGSAAPAPGPPGTTTSADPTESRHAPAMPQGHGGARV